jgi:hypothetical protein
MSERVEFIHNISLLQGHLLAGDALLDEHHITAVCTKCNNVWEAEIEATGFHHDHCIGNYQVLCPACKTTVNLALAAERSCMCHLPVPQPLASVGKPTRTKARR